LGKSGAMQVTLGDINDSARILRRANLNGDGIIVPEATTDAELRKVLEEIIATEGPEKDASGAAGVSQAKAETFFNNLAAYAGWRKKGEEDAGRTLPLGEQTEAAWAALQAVRAKVDDYFARCRLAAFDSRAAAALNRREEEFRAISEKELSRSVQEASAFPLARIEADRPLPLEEGTNPAWSEALRRLRNTVLVPFLGEDRTVLTEKDWTAVLDRLAPYENWLAAKTGAQVESLGVERVRALLASNVKEKITILLTQEKALEGEARSVRDLEKLVRFHRDLHRLLCNFVNFHDFCTPNRGAIFQAGILYLDGRACELCVRVEDVNKHAALAGVSNTCLVYCDCTRKGSDKKLTIAAALTGGADANLVVGRNGVFYDRAGSDWDAVVIKIIENPISLRQGFFAPYRRIARFIEEQAEKFAAARDKAATDDAVQALTAVSKGRPSPASASPAASPAFDIAKYAGIFAAIGMAAGLIGTAVASVVTGFFGLRFWQMPLAVLGIMLAISGPSLLLAWLRLRSRNLGPILDACGWAVNGSIRITIPFGKALTKQAELPPGSVRSLFDPFAEKKPWWPWLLAIMTGLLATAGALYSLGWYDRWLG
jgi:uncharacterized membrane protein YeaQ/YmgE (transglycosylase-associated protein family)